MTNNFKNHSSSFRDNDANVGYLDNKLVRKINKSYFQTFEKFISCGLYDELVSKNLIVKHEEISKNEEEIIISPDEIFISYPWEWPFSMLKQGAIATLEIAIIALKYDFILKDGNHYFRCFILRFLIFNLKIINLF